MRVSGKNAQMIGSGKYFTVKVHCRLGVSGCRPSWTALRFKSFVGRSSPKRMSAPKPNGASRRIEGNMNKQYEGYTTGDL